MNKMFKSALIFILVLLILGGFIHRLGFWNWNQNRQTSYQESFTSSEVSRVAIEADFASISILPAVDNQISIQFDATDDFSLLEESAAGELNLTVTHETGRRWFGRSGWTFSWNPFRRNTSDVAPELKVFLPDQEFEMITVNSDVGRIQIADLRTAALEVSSNVGEILVNDVITSSSSIQTNVSRIDLRNVAGNLTARSDIGEIQIELPFLSEDIVAETSVGAVTLQLGQQPENATLHASTDFGQSRIFGENSSSETFGSGEIQVKLSSSMGQVIIR